MIVKTQPCLLTIWSYFCKGYPNLYQINKTNSTMKKLQLLAAAFLLILTFISCRDTSNQNSIDPQLIGCWLHSYEEQAAGGSEIYRPCDYKEFGPSHYRRRIILKENQEAEYLELSPVDAHAMKPGTWEYDTNKKILRILDTNGNVVWSVTVLSIAKDKLEASNN